MSHWYKENSRFHPVKKDGQRMSESYSGYNKACQKAGAVMGVTDILKRGLPTNHFLIEWFKDQALQAGIDSHYGQESRDQWVQDAKDLLNERLASPADVGTDAHNVIETFLFSGESPENLVHKQMCETAAEFMRQYGINTALYEVTFSTEDEEVDTCGLYYGGTCDVLDRSAKIIVDWKTCGDNRTPYDKECIQLAAYRKALCPDARCINVYINRDTGRLHAIKEWSMDDLTTGWLVFFNAYQNIKLLEKITC